MNKNSLIALGVGALLLILGVSGYLVMSASKKVPTNTISQTTNPAAQQPGKMSLKQLMGMNSSQSCTFSEPSTGSSGTVYISGGKMRGDFMTKVNGVDQASHLLSDTETMYIWSDNEKNGFKTSLSSVEQVQESAMQSIDLNSEVDYQCRNWQTDTSKFIVPKGIMFSDYSEMMKDVSELMEKAPSGGAMSPNNPAAACATCENMEGDAKTACQTALKCN